MARYISGVTLEGYKGWSWRRRHLVNETLDKILDAENGPPPKKPPATK